MRMRQTSCTRLLALSYMVKAYLCPMSAKYHSRDDVQQTTIVKKQSIGQSSSGKAAFEDIVVKTNECACWGIEPVTRSPADFSSDCS
eukprot:15329492-Ditylum_brightwellii.AAC.1